MKQTFPLLGLVTLLAACGPTHVYIQSDTPAPVQAPPPEYEPAPAPPPAITYQTFYDALSPYGEWTSYPGVGYVWIPNVGPDFKPYGSEGRWVYSDQGWTWVSEYSWGWAPFHYGRWFFDDNYGWCWVPGYEWAPAWVSWRTSPDYYGWAPLAPTVGISISITAYNPPPRTWCFVPRAYVASPRVNNYVVNETRNVTIINNTTVINNYTTINNRVTNNNTTINNNTYNNNTVINNRNVYVAGPSRTEVEAATHTAIRPVSFRETSTPGSAQVNNNQVTLYRPSVRATAPASQGAPAPTPNRVAPFRGNTSSVSGGMPSNGNPNGAGQPNRFQGQPAQNQQYQGQPNRFQGQPAQNQQYQGQQAQPNRFQGQPAQNQQYQGQPNRFQGQPAQNQQYQGQQAQPNRFQGQPAQNQQYQGQQAQPTPTYNRPAGQPQQQQQQPAQFQPRAVTPQNQGNAQPGPRQIPPRPAPGQGDNQGRFKPGGNNVRQNVDTSRRRVN